MTGHFFYATGFSRAFPRVFFAGARVCLGRSDRRCGSAGTPPPALARGLDVGIYDGYLRNLRAFPTLSAIWRNASQQEQCLTVITSGGALRPPVTRERRPPCRRRRREDLCERP